MGRGRGHIGGNSTSREGEHEEAKASGWSGGREL